MSLVKSNGKSNTSAAFGSGFLNPRTARALGNALAQAYKSFGPGGNQEAPGSGANRRSNNRRPRKSPQGGDGWSTYGSGGPSGYSIVRPIKTKRLRAQFAGSAVLSNRVASVTNYNFSTAFDGGALGTLLGYVNPSDASILRAFTFFKPYSCNIRISPVLGTSATGFIAVGYTESTDPTLPVALTDVTLCSQNVTGSAWNPLVFAFKPLSKEVELYLNAPANDMNHRSAGNVRVYSNNNAAVGVPTFVMDISMDMEVW